MIKNKHFGFVMGLFIMFSLAITMSITVLILNTGTVALLPFIISSVEAFSINIVARLVIPASKLGQMFAKKCRVKENSFTSLALSNLITTGIYVTIVSFFMTLINVGFSPVLLIAWISTYPILFIVGVILFPYYVPLLL